MATACCSPSADHPDAVGSDVPSSGEAIDLLRLAGGVFELGADDRLARVFPDDHEGPPRLVEISPFRIAPAAVTNGQFARFVADTGYRTHAERYGWSFVFEGFLDADPFVTTEAVSEAPWWRRVYGATWNHPEGPGTSIEDRTDHPVVHVSWRDAAAYAGWAGGRLPTEAEWEFAARGGRAATVWPWGDEFQPGGRPRANIFEGNFPTHNTGVDGYVGTAPVTAYEPNAYGLYNVIGNVWEWCQDWFGDREGATSVDPPGPTHGPGRVTKGGSYLCHDSYCNRYRLSARTFNTPTSSTGHTGFRLAADV